MLLRFLSAAILLLLAGCATTPPFPEGIPTAMIRFTANEPVFIGVPCKKDQFVKGGFIKNSYVREISPVKMYGTRSDKNNDVVERLIPADRTLSFRVMWGGGVAGRMVQCVRVFSITPVPHEQYQVDYVLSRQDGSCTLKTYTLSEKNGVIQKTEIPVKRHPEAETVGVVCPNKK